MLVFSAVGEDIILPKNVEFPITFGGRAILYIFAWRPYNREMMSFSRRDVWFNRL